MTWFNERRNLLDAHSPLLPAASIIDVIDIAWKDGEMLHLLRDEDLVSMKARVRVAD